jgi:hypothetical protein
MVFLQQSGQVGRAPALGFENLAILCRVVGQA